MEQIAIDNEFVKITSPNGIIDTRNNRIYSDVVVKKEDVKYFIENKK